MKKRLTALLLTAALVFAIGANAAVSEDAPAEEPTAAEETFPAEETAPPPTQEAAPAAPAADAAGTLSFSALRGRMLAHYYPLLALEENVKTLEEWDYARTEDELRDALNQIAEQQFSLSTIPAIDLDSLEGLTPEELIGQAGVPIATAAASLVLSPILLPQLQTQYDACEQAYNDVRSGKMQADNAGVVRQLRSLQDQTVMSARSGR